MTINLVNQQELLPSHELEDALFVPFGCLEMFHVMTHRPDFVPAHHLSAIAYCPKSWRCSNGITERLIFIEFVYHHNPTAGERFDQPTVSQSVHRVGFQVIRSHLLLVAAVYHYCQFLEEGCTMFLDHLI